MDYANLDFQRQERTGVMEAVFCQGKKSSQVAGIIKSFVDEGKKVMATRATKKDYEETLKLVPEIIYYEEARVLSSFSLSSEQSTKKGTIAVITAGTADIPVAEEAAVTAHLLGNRVEKYYDVGVAGIHRVLQQIEEIRRAQVIIVVAGMEGALASVVGGLVEAPIVAVPTSVGYGAHFQGMASLLTMLNSCAPGVGVVNIDNGYGAACLASKINR